MSINRTIIKKSTETIKLTLNNAIRNRETISSHKLDEEDSVREITADLGNNSRFPIQNIKFEFAAQ